MGSSSGSSSLASGQAARSGARAWLGAAIIVGIAIYVILDVVVQTLPPHYNPIHQAESDLGVGPYGWLMSINFVIRGLIALAAVAGIEVAWERRGGWTRSGQALILLWAVGDALLAIFRTDVAPHRATLHGAIHLIVATLIFIAVAVGEIILSVQSRHDWRGVSGVLLGVAIAAAVALALLTLKRLQVDFGLVERLFIGLALAWMLIVGVRLLRPTTPGAR